MIASWMTQVLDHGIAGILGCFLFWMFGIAKFETAFSGFGDTSAWFLFGAICFGLMGSKSGLARRLAYLVMRGVGHSYPRLLLGLIVSNFLLTAVVPSGIARVVIMAAIAMGLVEAFGLRRGSNIARGMFVILRLPGDDLRQDGHRRRRVDHRARRHREVRASRRAVEPVVSRLPAVRHHRDGRRVAAGAVAVSAGDGANCPAAPHSCATSCGGWARGRRSS